MTTKSRSMKSHSTKQNPSTKETTMTTKSHSHTTTTQSTTTAPIVHPATYIQPPPADVKIPTVPEGFEAAKGLHFGQVKAKAAELQSMPEAVIEIGNFAEYGTVLGQTVPPQAEVLQMFDAATQWSKMRTSFAAWDAYCAAQEGTAWTRVREQMNRIKPAFNLAAKGNPSLAAKYPKLHEVLNAKATLAKKGASTRRLNKVAKAEGKPPVHGVVGKKRQRAAEKAAAATQSAGPPTTAAGNAAKPAAQGASTAASPATGAPAVGASPGPGPALPLPAVLNGAAHY